MMRVPATEAIVIVVVAAEAMPWMLAAEAIVVIIIVGTAPIPWMLATEVLLVLAAAKPMLPVLLAETTQAGRLLAEPMVFVPATEAAQVNVLKHRFGAGRVVAVKQRRSRDGGRRGRHDDPCLRRGRVKRERSEDDAGQQHATDRSRSSHGPRDS